MVQAAGWLARISVPVRRREDERRAPSLAADAAQCLDTRLDECRRLATERDSQTATGPSCQIMIFARRIMPNNHDSGVSDLFCHHFILCK
jgi:hypothetical protein